MPSKRLPNRVNRLAKQLGLPTPEEVVKLFEEDSSAAADVLIDVLNTMIASINANSRSKVLDGYRAVKEPFIGQPILLPKSNIVIQGRYEWVVYVKATNDHATFAKRNIFDQIDKGRPELPYRTKPYSLYGAALRSIPNPTSRREKVTFPSNARISGSETSLSIGSNPLGEDKVSKSRKARDKGDRETPMVFSRGPLTAIPAKFLYENAVKRAKDRLAIKGFSQSFDVVVISREEFGIE